MKKYLAIAATFVMAMVLTASMTLAQEETPSKLRLHQNSEGTNFVDADGDGVCDNEPAEAGTRRGNRGLERPNFVDADGDGICDNEGAGLGNGSGNGLKRNFVDADGDGVCDNFGTESSRLRQNLKDGSGTGEMMQSASKKGNGRRGR